MNELREKIASVKMIAFDLQGVIINSGSGNDSIQKCIGFFKDFCGEFKQKGIITAVITADNSLQEELMELTGLCVDVCVGSIDKVTPAKRLLEKYSLGFENLMFAGDGILDVPLLQKAGVRLAPPDAHKEVKRIADIILKGNGISEMLDEIRAILRAAV